MNEYDTRLLTLLLLPGVGATVFLLSYIVYKMAGLKKATEDPLALVFETEPLLNQRSSIKEKILWPQIIPRINKFLLNTSPVPSYEFLSFNKNDQSANTRSNSCSGNEPPFNKERIGNSLDRFCDHDITVTMQSNNTSQNTLCNDAQLNNGNKSIDFYSKRSRNPYTLSSLKNYELTNVFNPTSEYGTDTKNSSNLCWDYGTEENNSSVFTWDYGTELRNAYKLDWDYNGTELYSVDNNGTDSGFLDENNLSVSQKNESYSGKDINLDRLEDFKSAHSICSYSEDNPDSKLSTNNFKNYLQLTFDD